MGARQLDALPSFSRPITGHALPLLLCDMALLQSALVIFLVRTQNRSAGECTSANWSVPTRRQQGSVREEGLLHIQYTGLYAATLLKYALQHSTYSFKRTRFVLLQWRQLLGKHLPICFKKQLLAAPVCHNIWRHTESCLQS
jgi:hypothetical protein